MLTIRPNALDPGNASCRLNLAGGGVFGVTLLISALAWSLCAPLGVSASQAPVSADTAVEKPLLVKLMPTDKPPPKEPELDSTYLDLITDTILRMPSSEGTGASRYVGATYEGNTLADEVGVYWGREENCERKDVEFEYVNGGEKGPNKTVVASRLDTIDIGSGPEQHCVASLAWTVGSEPGLQTLRARPARVAPPPNTKSETQTNRLRPVEFQAVVHKNLGFVFGAGRVASTPDSVDFNDGVGPGPRGELNDQYQPIIGIDFSLATRNSRLQRYLLDALRFSVVTSAEQIGDDLYVGVQLLPVLRHYTRWSDVGAGPRAAKFPLQFTAAWRTGFKFEHDEWAILLHYSTGSLLSTITGAFKGSS